MNDQMHNGELVEEPPYRTPEVGEGNQARLRGEERVVLALDAIVNEMRAQTRMLASIHAAMVRR